MDSPRLSTTIVKRVGLSMSHKATKTGMQWSITSPTTLTVSLYKFVKMLTVGVQPVGTNALDMTRSTVISPKVKRTKSNLWQNAPPSAPEIVLLLNGTE